MSTLQGERIYPALGDTDAAALGVALLLVAMSYQVNSCDKTASSYFIQSKKFEITRFPRLTSVLNRHTINH